jgi:uncharacterized membrane protein (DUF2068 family)
MERRSDRVILLIAIFKLAKASLLVLAGIGVLRFVHEDAARAIEHGAELIRIDPHGHYAQAVIAKVDRIDPTRAELIGIATFVYAAVFATEGLGLLTRKRWAEWFTVIVTASFVPLEAYEIAKEPHPLRIVVLLVNLAIVAYLVWRLKHERGERLHV